MPVRFVLPPRVRGCIGLVTTVTILAVTNRRPAVRATRPRCFGARATIVGSDPSDVLNGTPHPDVITAMGGDDVEGGAATISSAADLAMTRSTEAPDPTACRAMRGATPAATVRIP